MGLTEAWRALVSKPEPPKEEPKPKTYDVAAGGTTPVYFGTVNRTLDRLEKYWKIYQQGGIICEAIDAYPLFCLANGIDWEFGAGVKGDQGLKDDLEQMFEKMNMQTVIWQGIVSALVMNDAFQENVVSAGGTLLQVAPRDPRYFSLRIDPVTKDANGYQFHPNGIGGMSSGVALELRDMTHLTIYQNVGELYGSGIVERAFDDINRDTKIVDGSACAIERHGHPKYQVRLGVTGENIPQTALNKVKTEFETLKSKNEFVTPYDVDIRSLDSGGVMNINEYNAFSVQRICTALGVPEEVLGLGRGSTEATAKVRLEVFYKKIAAIQKRVARCYNLNVVDRLLEDRGQPPGIIRFYFNDANPKDMLQMAQTFASLRTGPNPDAVIPADWAREQLGIPVDEPMEERT